MATAGGATVSIPKPSFVSSRSGNQLVLLFYAVLSVVTVILWVSNTTLDIQQQHPTSSSSDSFSALASWKQTSSTTRRKETPISSSQRNATKTRRNPSSPQEHNQQYADDDGVVFHIVFSTGCNAFQDWQSYVFFYQALQSGQTGHVTRVASGCADEEAAQALRDKFQEQIIDTLLRLNKSESNQQRLAFHLHITPDYSKIMPGMTYKFFNKPFGLRHWMEEGLGYSISTIDTMGDTTVIVILDPDQFILAPLRSDYTDTTSPPMRWVHPTDDGVYTIQKGRPFAQLYSFGDTFMTKVNKDIPKIVAAAPVFPHQDDASSKSPLYDWNSRKVHNHFDAGPPYMAVASDMYQIVATWAAIAVPVYELTTGHLSEMYAYSTAAAHVGLPHVLSYSFMVSNPEMGVKPEGWDAIDNAKPEEVCRMDDDATFEPPPILHYCQRYYLGPYFFSKYKLPKQFLNDCSHPLLLDPLEAEDNDFNWPSYYDSSITPNGQFNKISPVNRKRHAFLLCQSIAKINRAVAFYKEHHCEAADINFNKTFVFPMDKGRKRPTVKRLKPSS